MGMMGKSAIWRDDKINATLDMRGFSSWQDTQAKVSGSQLGLKCKKGLPGNTKWSPMHTWSLRHGVEGTETCFFTRQVLQSTSGDILEMYAGILILFLFF